MTSLKPEELIGKQWTKKRDVVASYTVQALVDFFNMVFREATVPCRCYSQVHCSQVSLWGANCIVAAEKTKQRAKAMTKIIRLMQVSHPSCKKAGDFELDITLE